MSEQTDPVPTAVQQEQFPTLGFEAPRGDWPSAIGRYRIEKLLGQGGFGRVYLAYDEQLQRFVALKVPHRYRVGSAEEAQAYLTEARTVANLDHPYIVPVYDVGSCEEFPYFIVSKYIEGTDLATKIKQCRFSVREASELVAAIAEALHYAHKQGLVHRDVKPGNILLDKNNTPFVVDFGLALREQDVGTGPHYAGTPAYMSPEQARGEGHRVDGRSDIFSLGVVFYSLLTGRRPFHTDSREELLAQITSMEARPPRQWDEAISKEVERICLKALSKRASERYTTAKDMADDLRHYLAEAWSEEKSHLPHRGATDLVGPASRGAGFQPAGRLETCPTPPVPPGVFVPGPGLMFSDTQRLAIVPKGLRSFDAADAAFFLELLPGPRDRDGLPDSIRFWKDRIETTGPDGTFAVGLLYGPSGCGKSSLVKAGLLPKLAKSVTVAYVEAVAEDTEARLLKSLRRQLPELVDHLNLIESLAALRRGRFLGPGQKVLLVLDQFEQWLHAKRNEASAELVQALRHCDGARLQCLVLVRDDFWLAVSRFMKALEVEIVEGQNSALVDLFDPIHARKVLAAFGRAYGRLPERTRQHTPEQDAFLNQAVAGLSEEGKVTPVRLALLAEMVKGKPWTSRTLEEVGGAEGVGVAFLEETFAAATAPPPHRLHRKAAQAVLRALLPEGKTAIKGHVRSQKDLLEASGYADRPRDFLDLIRLLDRELRLITPTEPESQGEAPSAPGPAGEKYYQLTHDYLVHSLRDWLSRKQRETRRGRAELQLAERMALWQAKPEPRQLPSLLEWLQIRLLTSPRTWTGPERQMMAAAARKHFAAVAKAAAVVFLLGSLLLLLRAWDAENRAAERANHVVQRLLDAKLSETPAIIEELAPYRRWADPVLQQVARGTGVPAGRISSPDHRLRAQLALLPRDSQQVEALREQLLKAEARDFPVIRKALAAQAAGLAGDLWDLLETPTADAGRRLRAAAALAAYDPTNPRWKANRRWVAEQLVEQPSLELRCWVNALRPVGDRLVSPLAARFRAKPLPVTAEVLGDYAAKRTDVLAHALADASAGSFGVLFRRLVEQQDKAVASVTALLESGPPEGASPNEAASRRANLAIALLRLGKGKRLWPLLKASPDPRCRSFLIDRLAALGCEPAVLLKRLNAEADDTVRAALLLSLGGFDEQALLPSRRAELSRRLVEIHRTDASAAVHAAAEWLLGKWKYRSEDQPVNVGEEDPERGWYVNGAGITMIRIAGPVTFRMGAAPKEPGVTDTEKTMMEKQHRAAIDRSYDIGMTEVTVAQFLRFLQEERPNRADSARYFKQAKRSLETPITLVTWYDAAAYCNWLNRVEGIPQDRWCYEPKEGRYGEGMKIAEGWRSRRGYRLPTEAEWEYACRGGAATSRCYGDAEELLPKYAWYAANATEGRAMPVAQLLPNTFGTFDMHGNAQEWCQDLLRSYSDRMEDSKGPETVWSKDYRVGRGGKVNSLSQMVRSAKRFGDRPSVNFAGGFRLARSRP